MTLSRRRVVSALGLVQIFAWGSSYYLIAPLAGAIAADTGWGHTLISAGVSVALLMAGLAAPKMGHWIGLTGGRTTLCVGMGLIAAGLILLSLAQTPWAYLLAWAVLGFGMAAGLYDAAFSVLGAAYGREARMAITQLTLWGGFASTVCWRFRPGLSRASAGGRLASSMPPCTCSGRCRSVGGPCRAGRYRRFQSRRYDPKSRTRRFGCPT